MAAQNNSRPERLLVCEGPEDCFFFHRLIEERQLPLYHIWPTGVSKNQRGGNTKFSEALATFELKDTKAYRSLKKIVIAADNDEDPNASFANVCKHIEAKFGAGKAPTKALEPTKTTPPIVVLMIPWVGVKGHLESLCIESARNAARPIGAHVDQFMATIGADGWANDSRKGKAWLRSNLAARCSDPFVPLGRVFDESKHRGLIPVTDRSFDNIAKALAT